MMVIIVIGYHEDTGEPIDGTVLVAIENDREACRSALEWVALHAHERVGGWKAFELLSNWGPGREIEPIPSDYEVSNR